MNKDKTIGVAIFGLCTLVAIFYVVTLLYPSWLVNVGIKSVSANVQFWVIAIPVAIGFVGILAIGSWIGWTMATTPPPKPIEEIQAETEHKVSYKEQA